MNELSTRLASTAGPLPALKVVVDPTVPRDELHVHPSMLVLMQQAVIEDQLWRTVRALVAKEAAP